MIPATLLGTGSVRPSRQRSTAEVVAEAGVTRDPCDLEARTGIRQRGWFSTDELPAARLGAKAVRGALERAGLAPADLRRLIFVSSTGGDFLIPATANAVLAELGVAHSCDAFDLNNACMGFLSAFDVAARSVATGCEPVAVVAVETLSRYVAPSDPRPYLVLADAAAAAVLGRSDGGAGVLAAHLGNDGAHRSAVSLVHPALQQEPALIRFAASNRSITAGALDALQRAADGALEAAGVELHDVEWIVPHQPNGTILRQLVERFGVAPSRLVPVVHEAGSVGAASLGLGLDALMSSGQVRPGERILLVGVGAGLSYGALVYRTAS